MLQHIPPIVLTIDYNVVEGRAVGRLRSGVFHHFLRRWSRLRVTVRIL
jgi:hypothetical protein